MKGATIAQQPDRPAVGRAIAVGIGALVVFAVAVLLSTLLLRHDARRLGEDRSTSAPTSTVIGRDPIGIVIQTPFAVDDRTARKLAAERRRLATWGWVDRRAGIVHMPIDRAIDELVAAHASDGGPR